jgi:hypothetical protein
LNWYAAVNPLKTDLGDVAAVGMSLLVFGQNLLVVARGIQHVDVHDVEVFRVGVQKT